jgi:Integrase core domain
VGGTAGLHRNNRVLRLYQLAGLGLRRQKRKRMPSIARGVPSLPIRVNECWALEFVTTNGAPGRVLEQWAYEHGVELRFIDPGKPVQNAFIESFNGKFRDECPNQHWCVNLAHARRIVETWRLDYNRARPHGSLGYLTPHEFANQVRDPNPGALLRLTGSPISGAPRG